MLWLRKLTISTGPFSIANCYITRGYLTRKAYLHEKMYKPTWPINVLDTLRIQPKPRMLLPLKQLSSAWSIPFFGRCWGYFDSIGCPASKKMGNLMNLTCHFKTFQAVSGGFSQRFDTLQKLRQGTLWPTFTYNYGQSPFLMRKLTIHGNFR